MVVGHGAIAVWFVLDAGIEAAQPLADQRGGQSFGEPVVEPRQRPAQGRLAVIGDERALGRSGEVERRAPAATDRG